MAAGSSHYFDKRPGSASRLDTITVDLDGTRLAFATDRSVFSPRRLDPGTAVLLATAPDPPPTGRFVDLGCGWGPLTVALARRSPDSTVLAVDVNERARALAQANAAALAPGNVTVTHPDDVVGEGAFDLLWSNPPVRIGKEPLRTLLAGWLDRLDPVGSAVLVVARNLGADTLHRWLRDRGHPTERIASKRGYRVLHVAPLPR